MNVPRRMLLMRAQESPLDVAVAVGGSPAKPGGVGWNGAESFTQTDRGGRCRACGPASANPEGHFAGTGIDTARGTFEVAASGCLDTQTLRVSDLEATDTYLATGDSVRIAAGDFDLALEDETCVASTVARARFRVTGGTGAYAAATGRGHFDIAMNWTPCNGLSLPAHVWFDGDLDAAR